MTQKGGGPYSDVYAFCATFYHLITGTCPPSAVDTIITPIKPPSELGADISPAAETVLMKGLERAYTDRIQTMGDLQRRLCVCPERQENYSLLYRPGQSFRNRQLAAG